MIDDKKIEEAANLHRFELIASMHGSTLGTPMQCFEEEVDAETDLIENSFITGAKWAINEFIKDLWHAIDENPKKYYKCLVEVVYHRPLNMTDEIDYVTSHLTNFGWDENSFKRSDYTIKRWIYIDDLLKGCNHD